MTHAELVERAAQWLRSSWRCRVVITEMAGGTAIPDAIGWTGFASILVECKTSRADFATDMRKLHRRADRIMGNYRFYLTEAGLLAPHEIPEGWGLAEIQGRRIIKTKQVACDGNADWRDERQLLLSCLQRLGVVSVIGVSVRRYTFTQTKCRATVGVVVEETDAARAAAKDTPEPTEQQALEMARSNTGGETRGDR